MECATFEETDDLELIKLVEVNSCLYNKKIWEFKTVDKKEVWAQIGAALTNKKTGDHAQKRWDSLRTMWSRQHRKYYEQGRSGSGASQDTQEFIYYGEMSFLIPHYNSRQTKSNMKRPAPCTPNDEYQESQFFICKPSCSTIENPCTDIQNTDDIDTVQLDPEYINYEYVSLDSDDSFPQKSLQEKKRHKFDDHVPFSPMAHAVLDKISLKQSLCNKNSTKQKYKPKENSNSITVPEPDEFCKKKKSDIDNYMRSSVQSLEKVAQSVENIISQKTAEKVNVSDSNIDKDISDMLKCAYVGLKQVRSDIRFNCILEVLKVINSYKEQGLQNYN